MQTKLTWGGLAIVIAISGAVASACSSSESSGQIGDQGQDASVSPDGATSGGNDAGGVDTSAPPAGECKVDADCTAKLPQTTPADCAVGKCDPLEKKCHFVAKDADGDGHAAKACSAASGTIETGDDCDDSDPSSYPGAWDGPPTDHDSGPGAEPDRCDQKDNDCNGSPDDGKIATEAGIKTCKCDPNAPLACYEYPNGAPIDPGTLDQNNKPMGACKKGSRTCPNGVPGTCVGAQGPQAEQCDDLDHDCNGKSGNAGDFVPSAPLWYKDADHDNFGDKNTPAKQQCVSPGADWKQNIPNTDCDDADGQDYPGNVEACDGKDNNCNGTIDEGVTKHFCQDGDTDAFCTATCTDGCTQPAGYILSTNCGNGVDCNDADGAIHPGATELCDGKDNNCNGTVDEGVKTHYCLDNDTDAFCTAACVDACTQPAKYIPSASCGTGIDCNDSDAAIHPGAPEVCDGKDNNCNGSTDEGVTTHYCADADTDSYCTLTCTDACSAPAGYRQSNLCAGGTDCNDSNASVHPGATEYCGDGVDSNCSGADSDGYSLGGGCQQGNYGVCKRNGTVVCNPANRLTTTCSVTAGTATSTYQSSASSDPAIDTSSNTRSYTAQWDWSCDNNIEITASNLSNLTGNIFATGSAYTYICNQGNYQAACQTLGTQAQCGFHYIMADCAHNCGGVYCTPAEECGRSVTLEIQCAWQQTTTGCDYIGQNSASTFVCR